MKELLIVQCNDNRKWYYGLVGQRVPLLAVEETEYKSLQPEGAVPGHRFVNFVSKEDAIIVEKTLASALKHLTLPENLL